MRKIAVMLGMLALAACEVSEMTPERAAQRDAAIEHAISNMPRATTCSGYRSRSMVYATCF